ncbi:MAG: NADH-quinone oxidoreductase subunit N [Candidatus Solibacter usitatus]|nr:NADH-quinone oxidoreductase subunit N [Candidatus Solibacter usitatus]
MNIYYTSTDHFVLLPAILLALFGCATLLFDFWVFPDPRQRRWLLLFLVLGEAFAGVAFWRQQDFLNTHGGELVAFNGVLTVDHYGLFFQWIFLATTVIVGLISYKYLEVREEHHGEYYGLLMLAQCGMFFLASGTELVTIFVGLETMAVTFYILVGFLRADKRSNEAALKYLLLGGLSSGFLAYGFSVLYGIAGSTKLRDISAAVAARDAWDPILLLAIATTAVGLLFKISAAPFHMWAPDAYEGAPTSITAFLAVGSKAASFALLMRLFFGPLSPARESWVPLMIAAAILSMIIGNFAAVTQTNTKRLLAYSGINHAGYILLGLIAGNPTGLKGMLVYLLIYTFMTLGAFLVLTVLTRKGLAGEDINDLNGLMQRAPGYAIWMLIFLVSLAGIPPTGGFFGKYFIFLALLETGHTTLAIIAALFVAVSVYYYFRMIKAIFVQKEEQETPPLATSLGVRLALGVTGVLTLLIGVYPEPFLRLAQMSISR